MSFSTQTIHTEINSGSQLFNRPACTLELPTDYTVRLIIKLYRQLWSVVTGVMS